MNDLEHIPDDPRLDKPDWSILVKTCGGTVSLLQNMPLKKAVAIQCVLVPQRSEGFFREDAGDIRFAKLMGPDGWDGCRKAMNHIVDFEKPQVVDSGPMMGRVSRHGKCSSCGEFIFEWLAESPVPPLLEPQKP